MGGRLGLRGNQKREERKCVFFLGDKNKPREFFSFKDVAFWGGPCRGYCAGVLIGEISGTSGSFEGETDRCPMDH